MHKKAELIGTIEELLAQVGSVKSAEAKSEPGGYSGPTTHPSKDVDDRLEDAKEGARSAENHEDIMKEPNRGPTVDKASAGAGGDQESVATQIGMKGPKETGHDPENETESAKAGKSDPGSTHPARTDNDSLDGMKYSSLRDLVKKAEDTGSALCAEIANRDPEAVASNKTAAAKIASAKTTPAAANKAAHDAGCDLAGVFAGLSDVATEDKQAADLMVVDTLEEVVNTAIRRAEKCAEFYNSHFAPDPFVDGGIKTAAGEVPPEAAAGGAGGGGPDDEALMQMLQGGEGMGGQSAMAGMQGGEGEGGGAPGGAAEGGEGEGGGGDEAEIQMLEQALQEAGITPEQLIQMLQSGEMGGGEAGGGAGGPPPTDPAAGGMPPGAGGEEPPKTASVKFRPKTAADQAKYAHMKSVINELATRSRR